MLQVHEIGHNLNKYHSGEGPSPYGDGTCMMGAHIYSDDAPQMCFNGAKSWYFGWYEDRHIEINPSSGSWEGKLVGVDDYVMKKITASDEYVVAKIDATSSTDLFLLYNRRKGVNSQVFEMGDMVTVVAQKVPNYQSVLMAGLNEDSKPYRFPFWNGGKNALVIQVCERTNGSTDHARVLVYLDDGSNAFSCSPPANPPTSPPTMSPTPPPTLSISPPKNNDTRVVAPPEETTTVTLKLSSGKDDYREKSDGATTDESEIHNLFSSEDGALQGYRFSSDLENSIPQGAVIQSAEMLVYPATSDRGDRKGKIVGRAVGHATGNAVGYQGIDFEISDAPKTASAVKIDPDLPKWERSMYQPLVDAAPIVEEIVGRGDYIQGNAIEIFLVGDGNDNYRRIKTQEAGEGAMLRVTYSLGFAADTGGPYTAVAGRQFLVDGSGSKGSIAAYTWDFGDGTTVTRRKPVMEHNYDSPGTYTVTLTVTNANGEKNEAKSVATVSEPSATADKMDIELQVSEERDDYRESKSGRILPSEESHKLFTRKFERQAFRFQKVPIPQGATILGARLEMMVKSSRFTNQNVTGIIHGEAVGNSRPFKWGRNQLANATKTEASVEIANLPTWAVEEYSSLGEISSIVQEIVNREDYSKGNAIKLILSNKESPDCRKVKTYEGGAGAKLVISYR